MRTTIDNNNLRVEGLISYVRARLEMTKYKVILMMLVTTLVGMCLAGNKLPEPLLIMTALGGVAMMAGSAATFNHLIDRHIDALMERTSGRPLPNGKVGVIGAVNFALVLGVGGFLLLYTRVNALTAWLTFGSLIGYALIYSAYLKRLTPQNIVIGGLAGAMPPLLGWTAVTNDIGGGGLLLVMIIFIWTPPHFWALAIHRKDEYAKADIPMLPVTHGVEFTKTCILLYTILLALVCLFPVLVGLSGSWYLVCATILSCGFIFKAWQLKFDDKQGRAMEVFRFSLYHLLILFGALLLDHLVM